MNMEEDELFTKKRHKTIGTVQIQHQVDPNWGNTDKVSVSTSGTTSTILLSLLFSFIPRLRYLCKVIILHHAHSLPSLSRRRPLEPCCLCVWMLPFLLREQSDQKSVPFLNVGKVLRLQSCAVLLLFIEFIHHTCSHANTEMLNLITLFYNLWF